MFILKMQVTKVLDPRLAVNERTDLLALGGSQYVNAIRYPVNSLSNSSITINANPNSYKNVVDPNIQLHCRFSIRAVGTNTSTEPLFVSGCAAPAFMPLRQIITNEVLSINGTSSPINNPHLFFPHIATHYSDPESLDREFSLTTSMRDQSSTFLSMPQAATSIRNPLSQDFQQTLVCPRGAHPGYTVTTNEAGGTESVATLDVSEPLIVAPCAFGKGSFNKQGMINIQNLVYTATLANLNKIMNFGGYTVDPLTGYLTMAPASGGLITITALEVNMIQCELLMFNFTVFEQIPRPLLFTQGWAQVQDINFTQNTALAPGQSVNLTLQTQTLSSIPRSVYIFAPAMPDGYTQTNRLQSGTVPTACLSIGNFKGNSDQYPLNVTFDNIQQCQSLTVMDLYKISKKNGVQDSFAEFLGLGGVGAGSLIKLNFQEDITLSSPNLAVGVSGKFQMNISLDVFNQTARTLPNVTLHAVFVYDGLIQTTGDGSTVMKQASFTEQEVAAIPFDYNVRFKPTREIFGGASFWEKLKSVWAPINKTLKDTKFLSTVTSAIPKYGSTISSVLKNQGYGYGGIVDGGCDDCPGEMRTQKGGRVRAGAYRRQ